MKKFVSLSLAIVLTLSCVFSAGAISKEEVENKWEYITTDDSAISIAPGADSTEMCFAWMSEFFVENEFYYGLKEDLSDAKQAKVKESLTFFSKKECNVRLTELSPETTYYYRHTKDGVMSDIYSFKTDTDGEGFTALFVSDAQIGRSGEWEEYSVQLNDTTGWYNTLEIATKENPDISLCLSAGDQANEPENILYNLFMAPDTLRSLPTAVASGNHDDGSPYLGNHYYNANEFDKTITPPVALKPYYFCKGNTLFIVLDTNNEVMLDHEVLIDKAIQEYPDTTWRVAMMHHGVYTCEDKGEENPNNRDKLVPMFEKYDIDLVLSGHSHMYSRTYVMKNFERAENGIVYIEGGCSSGCDCNLVPDPMPPQTAVGNTTDRLPTYTILTFSEDEIGVKAYLVENGETGEIRLIDDTVIENNGRDDSNAKMSFLNKTLQFILSLPNRFFSLFY